MAAAREAALDSLGHPELLRATLRAWTRSCSLAFVAVAAVSVLLRQPLARAHRRRPSVPWAAAAIPPTGVLWMLLCLQRGAAAGAARVSAGRRVDRRRGGPARLVFGAAAGRRRRWASPARFLGTPLAFVVVGAVAGARAAPARRARAADHGPLRTLRSLVGDGGCPIAGARLLASLQNIDVIMAKHQLSGDDAGSYAAAAVAAKAVVWVAIGIGLHLLPEATRRAAAGLEPRPVLLRALAIAAVVAAPGAARSSRSRPSCCCASPSAPTSRQAADALLVLGAAMTLLAVTYLTVQYMLALRRTSFLWVLGVVAVAEPFLLAPAGGIVGFAWIVLGVQLVAAASRAGARRGRTAASLAMRGDLWLRAWPPRRRAPAPASLRARAPWPARAWPPPRAPWPAPGSPPPRAPWPAPGSPAAAAPWPAPGWR